MVTDTFEPATQEKYKDSPLWKPWMAQFRLFRITSLEELKEYLEKNSTAQCVAWDVETTSLNPTPDTICGHCLSFDGREAVYIPVRHKTNPEKNLDPQLVWDMIRPVMDRMVVLVWNLMFEGKLARRYQWERPTQLTHWHDTMVTRWLWDPVDKQIGLKDSCKRITQHEMLEIHEVPGVFWTEKVKTGKSTNTVKHLDFSKSDPDDAVLYAAADPLFTHQLDAFLHPLVQKEQQFIQNLEHQLLDVLLDMEQNKVFIDRAFLMQAGRDLTLWASIIAQQIFEMVGREFDLGSPAKVGEVLAEKGVNLGRTKTGKLCTAAKEIEKLAGEHPIIDLILYHRSLIKENSTYVSPLLAATSDEDPYTSFKFKSVGAPTGRFSSGGATEEEDFAEMNAQSIPGADAYKNVTTRVIRNPPAHLVA